MVGCKYRRIKNINNINVELIDTWWDVNMNMTGAATGTAQN